MKFTFLLLFLTLPKFVYSCDQQIVYWNECGSNQQQYTSTKLVKTRSSDIVEVFVNPNEGRFTPLEQSTRNHVLSLKRSISTVENDDEGRFTPLEQFIPDLNTSLERTIPLQESTSDDRFTPLTKLYLTVPKTSIVYMMGWKSLQTGKELRKYSTSKINIGESRDYPIRVVYNNEGQIYDHSFNVRLIGGQINQFSVLPDGDE